MGKLFRGDKSSLKQEKKKKKKKLLKTVPFKQVEKVQTSKKLKKLKSIPELERRKKGEIVKNLKAASLSNPISGDMLSLKRKKNKKLFKAVPSENKVVKVKKEPEIIVKDLEIGNMSNLISGDMLSLKRKKKKKLFKAVPAENKVVKVKKEPEITAEESEESESESHVTGQNTQKEERRKRQVFVGNMPKEVDTESIVKLFSQYGEIDRVFSPKAAFHASKRSNTDAHVIFKDVKSAEKAIAANGQIYKGRHLIVHMTLNSAIDDATKRVFIGSLKKDVDEEGLWELFEPCGDIAAIQIVRGYKTGGSRGYGFVIFKESDSVEEALTLNGKLLKERSIRVQRSVKTVKKSKETLSKTPQKRKIQDSNVSNTENNFVKSKKSKKLSGSDNTSSGKKLKKEFSLEGQKVAENEGVKKKKKTKLNKEKRKKKKLIEKISDTSKPSKKQMKRKPLAKKMKFVPSSQ